MTKGSIATNRRGGAPTLVRSVSFLCVAVLLGGACKKDEPPPPLPEPKAVETAEAPLELKPEDAGPPPTPEKAAPRPSARRPSGLAQCCAALRQNAANAPEPTKGYMLYAAGACDVAAAQGKDKASAVSVITNALKGAGLPADCK